MKSGVLLLEYYTDSIDEVLLHYKSQKSAYCYLLDTNRRLLYHPFEKEIASEMYQEKTVKEAMACKNYKIEEQSGGKWLIERQQIGYTGWNVVLVNSMSSLDFESYNLHYVAWFTLLLVGVILIFLDILLFRSFTDPVYRLLQTMQEFGKGNYDIKAKEEGIGELKISAHILISWQISCRNRWKKSEGTNASVSRWRRSCCSLRLIHIFCITHWTRSSG